MDLGFRREIRNNFSKLVFQLDNIRFLANPGVIQICIL